MLHLITWCCYLLVLWSVVLMQCPVARTNIARKGKVLGPAWQIFWLLRLLLVLLLLLLLRLLLHHPEVLLHRQGLLRHRHKHRKHSLRLRLQRLQLLGCRGEERGKVLGEDFCDVRMRLHQCMCPNLQLNRTTLNPRPIGPLPAGFRSKRA